MRVWHLPSKYIKVQYLFTKLSNKFRILALSSLTLRNLLASASVKNRVDLQRVHFHSSDVNWIPLLNSSRTIKFRQMFHNNSNFSFRSYWDRSKYAEYSKYSWRNRNKSRHFKVLFLHIISSDKQAIWWCVFYSEKWIPFYVHLHYIILIFKLILDRWIPA